MDGERFNQRLFKPASEQGTCVSGKGKQRQHQNACQYSCPCQKPVRVDRGGLDGVDLLGHFHRCQLRAHARAHAPAYDPAGNDWPHDLDNGVHESGRKHRFGAKAKCHAALAARGVKSTSSVEVGNDIAGNIMEVVEREHIDMVVISTHGISGWHPLVFGSIAEKVVKLVQCPLLLLRSAKPDAGEEVSAGRSTKWW